MLSTLRPDLSRCSVVCDCYPCRLVTSTSTRDARVPWPNRGAGLAPCAPALCGDRDGRAQHTPSRGVPWLCHWLWRHQQGGKHSTCSLFQRRLAGKKHDPGDEGRRRERSALCHSVFTHEIRELLFCLLLPQEYFAIAHVLFKERGRSSSEPRHQRQTDCKVW